MGLVDTSAALYTAYPFLNAITRQNAAKITRDCQYSMSFVTSLVISVISLVTRCTAAA